MRFLLVDRILRLEHGKEAVVLKNVSNSEDFFADHFPGRPVMPGCLILESCDQAARLLLASNSDFRRLPRLELVANGKFRYFVQPGDSLHILYGLLAAISLPAAAAYLQERTNDRKPLIYALVSLFVFGVMIRGIITAG